MINLTVNDSTDQLPLLYELYSLFCSTDPPAHRLDSNTTGIVIFSRSRRSAKAIQRQFEQTTASKTYLCRVVGQPDWHEMLSTEPISSRPAEHGFRVVDRDGGDTAETGFRVLTRFPNGEALIEATPRTGRTNQIRVHLWHLGFPLVDDKREMGLVLEECVELVLQ